MRRAAMHQDTAPLCAANARYEASVIHAKWASGVSCSLSCVACRATQRREPEPRRFVCRTRASHPQRRVTSGPLPSGYQGKEPRAPHIDHSGTNSGKHSGTQRMR
ncbi:hypothetical protein AC233_33995 [Burkholderia sp. HB1]|jgi:hypothetical protein|nr:hypothetical protein AC233_33995 [Burkholderia sp. HB1]